MHAAWQARFPPPVVQHNMPAAQLAAVHAGVTQVERPFPPVTQVSPVGHSFVLPAVQICVWPIAQGAVAQVVIAGVPPMPPMPAMAGVRQQIWPPEQLREPEHEVTVAPAAHWLGLETHVFVAPPPPPTVQQVGVAPEHMAAPQLTPPPSCGPVTTPLLLAPAPLLPFCPPFEPLDVPDELPPVPPSGFPPLSLLEPPHATPSATPTETTKKTRAPFMKATSR
jgi:hypothetical protein